MTTLEILRDAYHLLDDKRRWTQGAYARRANGHRTGYRSKDAVCWCAQGAIRNVSPSRWVFEKAEDELRREFLFRGIKITGIHEINDRQDGYKQVRAAMRACIRRLEKSEALKEKT